MLQIQRYYNGIIGARRINAPTYAEAKRDLDQQFRVIIG
jgi:hypothetical protein